MARRTVCACCSDKGEIPCVRANGGVCTRDSSCPICKGALYVPCHICGGSGYLPSSGAEEVDVNR